MKITEKKLRNAVNNWLFEYNTDSGVSHRNSTDDKIAGKLGDGREDEEESTIPSPSPIIPMDQTAVQLQKDRPPVEDPDWNPASDKELSSAAEALASGIPESQRGFFYKQLCDLREKAIENANKPDLQEPYLGDKDIDVPIKSVKENRKRKLKSGVASKKTGYITNVTKNKLRRVMPESRARRLDFGRKWKQGDRLDLYRGDEDDAEYTMDDYRDLDDFDLDIEDGDEFVPDVDDIRDFMDATGEDDPTKVPGFTPEMAQSFGLSDIVKSNVYPSVSGESGITNKLEREIYPILRASKNAAQLTDRMTSLMKSEFGRATFYESMLAAKLIDKENIDELKKDQEGLMKSPMYGYVLHQTIVIPAMKQLEKLRKKGDYDPSSKKSQISPEQADAIIEKVKARWNGMTKARKANDAKKGMQANLEFLSRDTSVMG
tara:strand:- start:1244 stop:2539 length:1296 start_codon:yes stop_codon:yes gene_type:complete